MIISQITSELYPFMSGSKHDVRDLGESVYYLSTTLSKFGHSVSVFLPLYSVIDRELYGIVNSGLKTWVTVRGVTFEFEVYKSEIEGTQFYFMYNAQLFDRLGVYGSGGHEYSDNDIRFGTYCKACLNFISYHMPDTEIIHSYDWQTALIPIYSKILYEGEWKTVHTIHEIASQGIFPRFSIENLGLPWELYTVEQLEYYDSINLTKGAILYADIIVGIDLTQAESFLMSSSGFGLDGVFKKNQEKLVVIKNAVDYNVWCPETDKYLVHNYSIDDLSGKTKTKEVWCRQYDLNPDIPLFCVIGKYLHRNSIELVCRLFSRLSELPVNICFGGECDESDFQILQECEAANLRFFYGNNPVWMHNMVAASDFMFIPFVNPFRGKERWIAMAYGTIPVIRSFENSFFGDPVIFTHKGMDDFWGVVDKAVEFYGDAEKRWNYVRELMSINNSWHLCAKKYESLYRSLL